MSIPVQFTDRDLARGILVSPDWYRVKIDSVTPKLSKDKGSTNYQVEATILCNANDGSTDFTGAVLTWNFNSKAMGFTQGLFKALLNIEKLSSSERYDLEGTVGKEVEMQVDNGEWDNRIVNRVPHKYRACRES